MAAYYVNKNSQPNGDHEVHVGTCTKLPALENRHYLGDFPSCSGAVAAAKKVYPKSNGCFYCSKPCHTS
ncbi:hypothetical protein [Aeromonas salmonicida]|uniref:hypothetical protein n=1 Tax=Aeromonas salmonicida TaxID=645 RepID=UPI0038BBAF13